MHYALFIVQAYIEDIYIFVYMQFKVRAAWGPYGASVELASYANTQPLSINSGGFFWERAREQLEWYVYGMHLLVGG